eukprot:Clim_evm12s166 gene=Clim_evmTU12s166
MSTTGPGIANVTVTETQAETEEKRILRLKLEEKKKTRKSVGFASGTVDNEHLGRKKSKCCCIYERPKRWDESDTESDSDDDSDCCGTCRFKKGHEGLKKQLKEEREQAAHANEHGSA